jgi:hypothetical protein
MTALIATRTTAVGFALLLLLCGAPCRAQGIPLDVNAEEEDTVSTFGRRYDAALVSADGEEVVIDQEIEVPVAKNLELRISRLKPNSVVKLTVFKTGVELQTAEFQANELGEIILEVTTPKKKIGATVDVAYFAGSGKLVTFRCRVVFR